MGKVIKITREQLNEVKRRLVEEGWQLNPNKYQFVGAYLNRFREKLGKPNLERPDIHNALQSGYFNFRPNSKGYYKKEELDFALGEGFPRLKAYFGIKDTPKPHEDFTPYQWPEHEPHSEEKSEMELASDELLRDQEVMY